VHISVDNLRRKASQPTAVKSNHSIYITQQPYGHITCTNFRSQVTTERSKK